jgi:hypothetical protein
MCIISPPLGHEPLVEGGLAAMTAGTALRDREFSCAEGHGLILENVEPGHEI